MIHSTCFGHHYAHHQELETVQIFIAEDEGCCSTLVGQHPSTRTHNLQPHTTHTTSHIQSYVPHAVNICIVFSSWWWA